jgi:hypothetical protein
MLQNNPISLFHVTHFGSAMSTRSYTASTKYHYGFNTQEKDDEVAGDNNSYTAEFWQYDGRLGRRFNIVPRPNPSLSNYACLGNNPIKFSDLLGDTIRGNDNKPVTYEWKEGKIQWSNNATYDIKKIGESMLKTKVGEQSFNRCQNSKTNVFLKMDYTSDPKDRTADTDPGLFKRKNKDGQYKNITVTFYDKNIKSATKATYGLRWVKSSYEEDLGAIGCHEEQHNDPEQIKLDKKVKNERIQDPILNKPINIEVQFRKEYRDKFKIEGDDWKENYKKYGYVKYL